MDEKIIDQRSNTEWLFSTWTVAASKLEMLCFQKAMRLNKAIQVIMHYEMIKLKSMDTLFSNYIWLKLMQSNTTPLQEILLSLRS